MNWKVTNGAAKPYELRPAKKFYPQEQSPIAHVRNAKTPILLYTTEDDARVPPPRTDDITADVLAGAAAQLVDLAAGSADAADPEGTDPTAPDPLNADQLLDRARALRDELDEAGIADRERARHQARSFKRYRRGDGMTVYTLLADPENAAYLDSIYDSLTSPRRGGPRMVDLAAKARDEAIETDPRSLEQLSFDGILAILHIGADTDAKLGHSSCS